MILVNNALNPEKIPGGNRSALINRALHFWSDVNGLNAFFQLILRINRLFNLGVIDTSVVKYYTQALMPASGASGGRR